MGKKPITVAEMARMGGRARAAKYSREQLREFARDAGRPAKLDGRARRRLKGLLAAGKSQTECAAELGVSIRTIGRAVARMRAGG
jgi:DNA-binding NarL/FixJ family response regulator